MIQAIADTHAVIWYLFGDSRLSQTARAYLDEVASAGHQVGISSITLAEIVYLSERDRIPRETLQELLRILDDERSIWTEVAFDRSIALAMQRVSREEIPELADRMIASTALHLGVPVITRDHKIQSSNLVTIW